MDLTLIPRGTGKLEIIIDNLYQEMKIKRNKAVDFLAYLRNEGTLPLFNVTAVAGLVLGLVVLITAIVFVGVRLSRR